MNDGMFVMLENASLANSGGLLIIENGFNKKNLIVWDRICLILW